MLVLSISLFIDVNPAIVDSNFWKPEWKCLLLLLSDSLKIFAIMEMGLNSSSPSRSIDLMSVGFTNGRKSIVMPSIKRLEIYILVPAKMSIIWLSICSEDYLGLGLGSGVAFGSSSSLVGPLLCNKYCVCPRYELILLVLHLMDMLTLSSYFVSNISPQWCW